MSRSQLLTALAGSLLLVSLIVSHPLAQQATEAAAAPQPEGNGVAFLDVRHVLNNFTRFKAKMAEMRADAQRAQSSLQKEQDGIHSLAEQLKQLQSGSPEHTAMQKEIAKRQADLKVRIGLQRQEFLKRETKVYYDFYQEIRQEVEEYATAKKIATVLRLDGGPVNVQQPEEVLRYVNNPVVWFAKELDITPIILERLNQDAKQTEPGRVALTEQEASETLLSIRPKLSPPQHKSQPAPSLNRP